MSSRTNQFRILAYKPNPRAKCRVLNSLEKPGPPHAPIFLPHVVHESLEALETLRAGQHAGNPFALAMVISHGKPDELVPVIDELLDSDDYLDVILLTAGGGELADKIAEQYDGRVISLRDSLVMASVRQLVLSLCRKRESATRLAEVSEDLSKSLESQTRELDEAHRMRVQDMDQKEELLSDLKTSEERYRLLFEKDITGNFAASPDGTILECNQVFAMLFGFESRHMARQGNLFEIWRDMGANEPLERLLSRSSRVNNFETSYTSQRGQRILAATFDTTLDEEGKLAEIRGYFHDVTEQRKMETQLRMAHKMEALGTLAGGVAHDFNNILGVIMGYAEIIDAKAEQDSGLERRIREIIDAGKRGRDLVEQILNFSRQRPKERQTLSLTPLVKEALKLLKSTIPEDMELLVEPLAREDKVLADPTQIHQIMLNLCTNAIQAMETTPGGSLKVTVTEVEAGDSVLPPGDNERPEWFLRLSVSDTGPGMDESILDRIFDPFFTTKAPGLGTGMGLSVVHGIVKRHEGYVMAESEPGKGTTFHVFLPRAMAAPDQPADVDVPVVFAKGRIMFVDDEKPMADIGKDLLEQFGFDVVVRTSSVEALEAFRHRADDFDLIITDQYMPNMNGTELAQEIFKIRPDMPIVLCTSFSQALSTRKLRESGVLATINKPILKNELIATISRLLGEKEESS